MNIPIVLDYVQSRTETDTIRLATETLNQQVREVTDPLRSMQSSLINESVDVGRLYNMEQQRNSVMTQKSNGYQTKQKERNSQMTFADGNNNFTQT